MSTPVRTYAWVTPLRWILLALAVICFVLAAFHVAFATVDLIALGLALFAGSFIVPWSAV